METIIWILHNVMPWVGAWFTVMTVIYFSYVIYSFLKGKFLIRSTEYCVDRIAKRSLIVSLVPFLLLLLVIPWIDKYTRKINKEPTIVKIRKF